MRSRATHTPSSSPRTTCPRRRRRSRDSSALRVDRRRPWTRSPLVVGDVDAGADVVVERGVRFTGGEPDAAVLRVHARSRRTTCWQSRRSSPARCCRRRRSATALRRRRRRRPTNRPPPPPRRAGHEARSAPGVGDERIAVVRIVGVVRQVRDLHPGPGCGGDGRGVIASSGQRPGRTRARLGELGGRLLDLEAALLVPFLLRHDRRELVLGQTRQARSAGPAVGGRFGWPRCR